MYDYTATVLKVVDGDTIDLRVDLGFHVSTTIRTRILGIDAPEVRTQEGKNVRDYLRLALPPGTQVQIQTEKDPGDKYGRWLATIREPALLGDVATHLIERGMAVAYSGGART